MMSLLGTSFTWNPTLRPFFPMSWGQRKRPAVGPKRVGPPVQQYLPAEESNRAALAALGLPGRVINAPLATAYTNLLPPIAGFAEGPAPAITMQLGGYRGPPARFGSGRPTLPPIRLGQRQETGYHERRNPVFARKAATLRALKRRG